MRRVCDILRADSRLGFNFFEAATARIVDAARVRLSWANSRLSFNFVRAPTARIVNAARVRPSSD